MSQWAMSQWAVPTPSRWRSLPTVALEMPSAQVLADQSATIQDLQFVMDCCKRLLAELAKPVDDQDLIVALALWSAALVAYARCFSKGSQFGLDPEDVRSLPLQGAVMKFHAWAIAERRKLTVIRASRSRRPRSAPHCRPAARRPGSRHRDHVGKPRARR